VQIRVGGGASLAQGDSAFVRRDALVLKRPEAFLAQPANRALG
jgi:hypothetical protein